MDDCLFSHSLYLYNRMFVKSFVILIYISIITTYFYKNMKLDILATNLFMLIHGMKCFSFYCALWLHRNSLYLQNIIDQLIFRAWLIFAIVNNMLS